MKNSEILEINTIITVLKNTGLSVETLTKLVRLKMEISKNVKEFYEIQDKLLDKYNVPNGKIEAIPIDQQEAFIKERKELLNNEVKIEQPTNFMTFEELHKSTEGLSGDLVAKIAEYLVKI